MEGRDDAEFDLADDEDGGRLPQIVSGERADEARRHPGAALHPAAAALHRGDAGQAHGGARHRPALDLRLDRLDDPGARIRPQGEEPPLPRGQGPARHRFPRQLLRPLPRLRLHRRPRGGPRPGHHRRRGLEGAARPVLERLLRAPSARPRACASPRWWRRSTRCSGPHLFPVTRGRSRAAPLQGLRHRPARAQDLAQGLAPSSAARTTPNAATPAPSPATPTARPRRSTASCSAPAASAARVFEEDARRRPAGHPAQGPLRLLRPARRGRRGREAAARLDPQGHGPRRRRPRARARAPVAAAARSAPTPRTARRSRPASAASARS